MIRVDQIVIGIIWGVVIWPELRDALMMNLFCNPALTKYADRGYEVFGGSCNFAFIIFFIFFPTITVWRFLPYIIKFIQWINGLRS